MRVLALLVLVLFSGCGKEQVEDPPASGPYSLGAQYSREHNGLALLVYENNELTYIDNQNGGTVDTPYHVFSGTKSFNCAMMISAITDGLFAGFDDLVSDTITEWQGVTNKSAITIRHLLSFTSGLSQTLLNLYLFDTDSYRFSFGVSALTTPGTEFKYGETHLAVFEEVMRRVLAASASYSNLDPLGYLQQKVLSPIGLDYYHWIRNSRNEPFLSFGAYLTAREWLNYGILLRDNGSYNGNAILNNALLTQCITGSAANAGYGLTFWLNAAMPAGFAGFQLAQYVSASFVNGGPTGLIWPGGDSDLFAAVGVNDNRLYIFRSRNMIVVRMGRGGAFSTWSDAEFLNALFRR